MAGRRGRGGCGTKANERAGTAAPSEVGTQVVDLNSRSATHIASIVFYPVQQHNQTIKLFKVHDCLLVCQHFRRWLQTAGTPDIREVVRIDDIELNLIAPNTKGSIFFLENAATLEGEPSAPVSIFALYIPNDKRVRYLWTPLSPTLLLTELAIHDLVGPPVIPSNQFKPTFSPTGAIIPPYHHTVYTIVAQCFEHATKYPDSPEMIKAARISDVCPSILDPATAHRRVDAADTLHSSHDPNANGKDLSDDRYILELHPAERELASLLYVGCAEYLFIKRTYFRAFSRETVLHAAKIRRAAAHMRNMNMAASTQQIQVKGEDEEDEGGDDGNKENNDPPAGDLPAPIPEATASTTRSRTRTRKGVDQQSVNTAVPLASTEQMDVTMKDTEDDDEVQSEDPPAEAHNPRVTRLRLRARGSTANPVVNPVTAQSVAQAAPLASIEQNDVTMKDQEDDDVKQSEEPTADTPNPRAACVGARTQRSAANSATSSIATQNKTTAKPTARTEQSDTVMKDKEDDQVKTKNDSPAGSANPKHPRGRPKRKSAANSVATQKVNTAMSLAGTQKVKLKEEGKGSVVEGDNENDDSPAESPDPQAEPPPKRARGRPRNPTRQSTTDLVATDNENDDSAAGSSNSQAAPPPKRARGRPRGPTRQSTTDLAATDDDKAKDNSSAYGLMPTIPKAKPMAAAHRTRRSAAEDEDEDEYDNQSNDSPAPTESSNARETPAATRARARADRPRLSSTQLGAVRSSAAQVGARNRALRVRTENKHIRTLEEQAGFTYRVASKWILGWNVLGFLDEERVLAVQEGNDGDGEDEWSE
jgi:hypothetical protein